MRDSEGLASDAVLRYLNRASDLAFALARFADEPNPEMFEGRERRLMKRPSPAGAGATSTRSRSREHRLIVDEPEEKGGTDQGPTPAELLAASLATCTAITIEMYADRKEWGLGTVEVEVDYTEATTDDPPNFDVRITLGASSARSTRDKHPASSPASARCTGRSSPRTSWSTTPWS